MVDKRIWLDRHPILLLCGLRRNRNPILIDIADLLIDRKRHGAATVHSFFSFPTCRCIAAAAGFDPNRRRSNADPSVASHTPKLPASPPTTAIKTPLQAYHTAGQLHRLLQRLVSRQRLSHTANRPLRRRRGAADSDANPAKHCSERFIILKYQK